jgi:hypothetical protein
VSRLGTMAHSRMKADFAEVVLGAPPPESETQRRRNRGHGYNFAAHKDDRGVALITARGATVQYLPPYGRDLNPIEPGWGFIQETAPRRGPAKRLRLARDSASTLSEWVCARWFRRQPN